MKEMIEVIKNNYIYQKIEDRNKENTIIMKRNNNKDL